MRAYSSVHSPFSPPFFLTWFLISNSMPRKNELSLGEAIDSFLQERGLKDKADMHRVIAEWPNIMGRAIAENTDQLWFHEGIFYVRMASPVWKNELAMAKSKILEMVNRELGRELVQEVRII